MQVQVVVLTHPEIGVVGIFDSNVAADAYLAALGVNPVTAEEDGFVQQVLNVLTLAQVLEGNAAGTL